MEKFAHCAIHRMPVKYVCPACDSLPLCETCKLEHEAGTRHAPENCKEVGLAIMHQRIQCAGGRQANELAKGLRYRLKELEAGFLREIDGFRSSYMQTEELRNMKKLDIEGRYAELYLYAKNLPVGEAKSKAATGELDRRHLEMMDTASAGLNKVLSDIVAVKQHKPVFAAYKESEVLVLKDESDQNVEQILSVLHDADMSKFKAVYINLPYTAGDCVASELASHLQIHPVSALYFSGRNISDAGAEMLAQAAFLGKSLSAFCIDEGWSISDTGAKAVAEAARNCRSLTTFYLSGWSISDTGAKAVAEVVKDCPLSVFYLGGGRISDVGAIYVAKTVKDCPLSMFCLGGKEMSDAGAIAVANTIKDCQLSVFYLAGREISDSGAVAVAKTLSSSGCASTLSAFCLWSDCISGSGAGIVADVVGPLLSEFYIEGKPMSGEKSVDILYCMACIGTIQSVNIHISEISKEQMDFCLDRLQISKAAGHLKLRFGCDTVHGKSVCQKFRAEWNAKLAKFEMVSSVGNLFREEVIIGVPK